MLKTIDKVVDPSSSNSPVSQIVAIGVEVCEERVVNIRDCSCLSNVSCIVRVVVLDYSHSRASELLSLSKKSSKPFR